MLRFLLLSAVICSSCDFETANFWFQDNSDIPISSKSLSHWTPNRVLGWHPPCLVQWATFWVCSANYPKTAKGTALVDQRYLSNENNPSCLGYIADSTTELYGDYNKPLNKDPVIKLHDFMESKARFFFMAHFANMCSRLLQIPKKTSSMTWKNPNFHIARLRGQQNTWVGGTSKL